MKRNSGNASSIGTATHTEHHYPESTSKTKRPSKKKCIYYDCAPKECAKLHIGCPGPNSPLCKYYRETMPVPTKTPLPAVDEKTLIPDLTPPAIPLSNVKDGVTVRHKNFGTGAVTKIDAVTNCIYVSFSGNEKCFSFPEAFTKGFLELLPPKQPKKRLPKKKKASPAITGAIPNDQKPTPPLAAISSPINETPPISDMISANNSTAKEISQNIEMPKSKPTVNWFIICGIGAALLTFLFVLSAALGGIGGFGVGAVIVIILLGCITSGGLLFSGFKKLRKLRKRYEE